MPINGLTLLTISLAVILPLVPTVVIYKVIRDKRTKAGVTGTILGLKIESSGAIAAYVICTLLLIMVSRYLLPQDYEKVKLSIQVSGDPNIVNTFLQKAETSAVLTLTNDSVQPIRFEHFSVNSNQKIITAERDLPPAYLGRKFSADLTSSGDHYPVKPNSVVLQNEMVIEVVLGSESQRRAWTAAFDVTSNVYKNQAQDLYAKEIIMLTHDSPEPLGDIILHNYLISAPLVYMEVAARVVDRKSLDGLRQQWTRESMGNVSPDSYSTYFDNRFQEYKALGDELAIRHFTNDNFNLPGMGSRFQRGNISLLDADHLIPIIGPVPGGISSDKAVIIFYDSWWRTFPQFQRSAAELTLGQTFERPTRRVMFGILSTPDRQMDLSSVRTQYKQDLITPVQKMGDAQVRKGNNSILVDLDELPSGSVVNLLWSWK